MEKLFVSKVEKFVDKVTVTYIIDIITHVQCICCGLILLLVRFFLNQFKFL